MKGNTGLASLQLYGGLQDQDEKPVTHGITEATGVALADALRVNTSLTTLQLGAGVSPEAVQHMLRALLENKTVTTLHLFMGGLPNTVAVELANVLTQCSTLRHLQLAGDISDEAGHHLSLAIYSNTTLKDLQLGTRVSSPGAFRLLMVWNGRGMKQSLLLAGSARDPSEDPLANPNGQPPAWYPSTTVMRTFMFQGHVMRQGRLVA